MRQLLTEVVKDLQLTLQLQEAHVLVLRMWHFAGEETVRIHLEMSRQLLNPLLRAGEALRENVLLLCDGILKDQKRFFWIGGENLDCRHQVLLENKSVTLAFSLSRRAGRGEGVPWWLRLPSPWPSPRGLTDRHQVDFSGAWGMRGDADLQPPPAQPGEGVGQESPRRCH
ncbi:MAG: hypothetical protein ACRERE_01325, partial [Candidatus Entotheonellia bacterium]